LIRNRLATLHGRFDEDLDYARQILGDTGAHRPRCLRCSRGPRGPTDAPRDYSSGGSFARRDSPASIRVKCRTLLSLSVSSCHEDGDLVIQVISPAGQTATLSNRAGGAASNFVATGLDISASFTSTTAPSGQWRLFVQDLAKKRTGTITSFALHITSSN